MNSSNFCFSSQIAGRFCISFEQPNYTIINPLQYPHPTIKHLGCDLKIVVEAAEDECILGQPYFRTRKRSVRDATLAIISLVTVWQVDDLFRKVLLIRCRYQC